MEKHKFVAAGMIVLTLILAGVIAVPTATLRAQSGEERAAQLPATEPQRETTEHQTEAGFFDPFASIRARQAEQLEGSWDVTVTPAVPPGVPQPPAFHAYATFARGGASTGSDRQRPNSKQHGSWVHLYGNEFALTRKEDLFDSTGQFAGTIKVRTRIIVTGTNEFVGIGNGEQRDADGQLVFNSCSRVKGERIQIEPLAPQCQSLSPFQ